MSLRALVADDEAVARDELAYMLRRVGGIDVVDQASSGTEALARLHEAPYDVLFMDIRMPGLSGLQAMEVVSRLPRPPRVVFVTASDEHAVAAFEVAATDYLVKPVSEPRLRQTMQRIARDGHPSAATGTPALSSKLPFEQGDHTTLVRIPDIRFVFARDHHVLVRTFDTEHRARQSLAELEELLAPHGFLRVHRAYLVNLDHVLEVYPFFAGAYLLRVDDRDRSEVPVSRALAGRVRDLLGI
jgi:two-component system, LytTR family, response regulator LytT